MAESTTLARPYAKAVFEFAQEKQSLDSWASLLNRAAAVTQLDAMKLVLTHPMLTSEEQADVVFLACQDPANQKAKNLFLILAENKRLSLLPEISKAYEQLKAESEKLIEVSIISAFDVEASVVETLKQALSKKLEKQVSIQVDIDKNLIGGVVIRAGDTVIDGSVRGKLAKLADAMKA